MSVGFAPTASARGVEVVLATYLFAFNPAIWNWPQLAGDIRRLARQGHLDRTWSCGRHRNIEPGSRAFLVRLGVPPKGIMGAGVTMSVPETVPHWIEEKAAAGLTTNRIALRLESLFVTPPVTFDDLVEPPFGRFRWGVRSSGTYLPETIADAFEDLWEARVAAAIGAAADAPTRSTQTAKSAKARSRRR